jgi:prepilin-type N-terminal cleavage/methylation domain-containing protein
MKHQSGFTLVEIAIVLVIIGLLLGGVLKGQQIITNAKVSNVEKEFNSVSVAIYNYQDRYRALPGDDKKADTRFGLGTTKKGNGNWKVDGGVFDVSTGDVEPRLFWLHLRNAGLITGPTDDNGLEQPMNSFNGVVGVATSVANIPGLFVGFSNIPSDIALFIDTRNDDGTPDKGSVQATLGATTPTDYTGTGLYSIYYAM